MAEQWNGDGGVGYAEYHDDGGGEGGGKSFGGSCIICMFGFLLFPASLGLLGWNEKNTVCQDNILMMAEDDAVVGECGGAASAEGKFTFFSCPIDEAGMEKMTPATSFNLPGVEELVSFKSNAGAQKIEMYQCIETKEDVEVKSGTSASVGSDGGSSSVLETSEHPEDDVEDAPQKTSLVLGPDGTMMKDKRDGREKVGRNKGQKHASLAVRSEEHVTSHDRRRRSSGVSTETASVYRYKMGWSDVYYNSHEFKGTPRNIEASGCTDFLYKGQVNHNPAMPDRGDGSKAELGRHLVHSPSVIAGGYTLADETELQKLTAEERISLTEFAKSFSLSGTTDNIVTKLNKNTLAVHAGTKESAYYLSTCNTDRLGCVRVSYNKSDVKHISVMGHTSGAGVMKSQDIKATWGCDATNFLKMYPKEMTKGEMINAMKTEKKMTTWAFRVVGLIAAWLALYCCFNPIANAADVMGDVLEYIPVIGGCMGGMLEGVVEMFLCLISCGFGLSCGLFVIALVWLGMRPMIGGPLMGGVVLLFAVGFFATRKAERDPRKMRKGKSALQQPYQQQGHQAMVFT